MRTNSIGVLNDRTLDAATVEQEVIYVSYLDPDNFEPSVIFLTAAELKESQGASGLKQALFKSFEYHNIGAILKKKLFSSHRTDYQ